MGFVHLYDCGLSSGAFRFKAKETVGSDNMWQYAADLNFPGVLTDSSLLLD